MLLALTDGAGTTEIKRILKVKDDDVRLVSPRMREAVNRLREALLDPHSHLPESLIDGSGYDWADHYGRDIERHLRQQFFASTAVCLFGEAMPMAMTALSLRDRLAVYCIAVEEADRARTMELLHCSEYAVRQAMTKALAAIVGL
ncbi:MAG: hypothetical protein M3Q03_09885 [Chloroflexota bacterium]|nr:hypothetical protein [Chloroflexota bacterium]